MQQRLRLSLAAWRRLYKKHDPSRHIAWGNCLSYALAGATQSALMRIQATSQAEALKTVIVPPPIFLLGFWRSGTTFLHELICSDSRFGFPSTYACLNPAQFLLTEKVVRKQELKQSRRPMDDLRYSWTSPQEDEFALLCMGAASPYEALIFPSLLRNPRELVDFSHLSEDEQRAWQRALDCFLKLLTIQQNKPMVLKSPPHGFRFSTLAKMFPEARFVLIERNPYEVFASNLKLWETLSEIYGLESVSSQEIEEFVLQAYMLHEQAIEGGARAMQKSRFARVRYEDLVSDATAQMERLYRDLALGDFERVRPRMREYLSGVANHKRNRFQISTAQKSRIGQLWGLYIEQKQYGWNEEFVSVQDNGC